jgi:hypothetical protein
MLIACFENLNVPRSETYIRQLEDGLLKYWRSGLPHDPNYVTFTFSPEVSIKYEDKGERWHRITGIKVSSDAESDTLSIYVSHGLVTGLRFESDPNFAPIIETVDTSNAHIEFLDKPDPQVGARVSAEIRDLINWSEVFEVELNGEVYYQIKPLEDGDFIGIDKEGNLFEVRHDPFSIETLKGDPRLVLTDLDIV